MPQLDLTSFGPMTTTDRTVRHDQLLLQHAAARKLHRPAPAMSIAVRYGRTIAPAGSLRG